MSFRIGFLMLIVVCVVGGISAATAGTTDDGAVPTLTGVTGLIRIPSADIGGDKRARILWTSGMHTPDPSIGSHSTAAVVLNLLPHLETALSLGPLDLSKDGTDLSIHCKLRLTDQRGWTPALAIGGVDIGRNRARTGTRFLVATWHGASRQIRATLGVAEGNNDGFLAGLQWRPVRAVELMGEYDTRRTNWAAVVHLTDQVLARVANLSTGTTATIGYSFGLEYPRGEPTSAATSPSVSSGEAALNAVRDELAAMGLEDVRVWTEQDSSGKRILAAAFENRVYTLVEQDCLPEVLASMSSRAEQVDSLAVRFLRRGIAVAECRVPIAAYRAFAAGRMDAKTLRSSMRVTLLPARESGVTYTASTGTANPSAGHVDAMIGPGLRSLIGTEQGRFKYGLYLRPEVSVPLAPGWLAYGAWQAPITGDLVQDEPKRWKTHRSVVSYSFSPAQGWLAQILAGRCPGSTDVAVLEVLRAASGRSFLRLTTGYADSDLLKRRLYAVGEYWHIVPQWNVHLRLVGGRYLSGDTGGGLDVMRQFGATEVTLGGRLSSTYNVLLVRLTVPLSPRRQPAKPSSFRVRTADYFVHTIRTLAEKSNYVHLLPYTSVEIDAMPNLRDTYLNSGRLMPDSGYWLGRQRE